VKILHIVNWFPNSRSPLEALWIQRQIKTLNIYCSNTILHIQVIPSTRLSVIKGLAPGFHQLILEIPLKSWMLVEWLTAILLVFYLKRMKVRKEYDMLNFHIAYPLLTHWKLLRKFFKTPIVVNEHWSAYHFNFGVERELPRIQRIFKQNIPVIAVSQALVNDIKNFAKADFPSYVIPNVVDEKVFFSDNSIKKENFFFMVSQWKYPKNPFPVMAAFLRFNEENQYKHRLKIGGYGVMWSAMTEWVKENDTKNTIYLLGIMESTEIANAMRSCKAFLHPTYYETFSVVCAEAVACGAIVAAPNVGGIPEVVNENCILLENWEENDWYGALKFATAKNDEPKLQSSGSRFSHYEVGKSYYKVLNTIISEVG
jgi:L-malate glycosyltransferase